MTQVAWKNGELVPAENLSLPVSDLGVVAGASITEMARTFRHTPFRLKKHLDRLCDSCEELRFAHPYTRKELLTAANKVIEVNCRELESTSDLGIVIFVTAGSNRTYLGSGPLPPSSVIIHTFELPFAIWKPAAESGVRLVTVERHQPSEVDFPVHLKTRNRLHWWLADQEANDIQSGARALLLDRQKRITETSTSAFYALIDGVIVTPKSNVLNSMSRRLVREAAKAENLNFDERDLSLQDLENATECFVSSTPVGILPVSRVNQFDFPVMARHSVVPALLSYWERETSVNPFEQMIEASDSSRPPISEESNP